MMNRPKPLVLQILDGSGYSLEEEYNAIAMANTPWVQLQRDYPMTLLKCSGHSAGFPDEQTGNSEAGHIHIGTGLYVPDAIKTADHGNIEQMVDKETGQLHSAHTTIQAPLVYVCWDKPLASGGGLSDLAPTMPAILGLQQSAEMTGRSIITAA
jgi:bisphosphoglycerate-independent phosphoglycerate mutase (AlkP superfamily)